VVEGLSENNFMTPLKRVGLRYKDIIQKSKLANVDMTTEWSELLNSTLAAVFIEKDLSSYVNGFNTNLLLELAGTSLPGRLASNYGIVTEESTKEECFLIDSDFYAEGFFTYKSARTFLNEANIKSRNYFHWCLTPKLYIALRPTGI